MIANHPERQQIRLEKVLTALGHPLRLAVVRKLAAGANMPVALWYTGYLSRP